MYEDVFAGNEALVFDTEFDIAFNIGRVLDSLAVLRCVSQGGLFKMHKIGL